MVSPQVDKGMQNVDSVMCVQDSEQTACDAEEGYWIMNSNAITILVLFCHCLEVFTFLLSNLNT